MGVTPTEGRRQVRLNSWFGTGVIAAVLLGVALVLHYTLGIL